MEQYHPGYLTGPAFPTSIGADGGMGALGLYIVLVAGATVKHWPLRRFDAAIAWGTSFRIHRRWGHALVKE